MRTLVRGLGQLLVTLGMLVLLLCVYELWWTGVATDQAQGALRDRLRQGWSQAPAAAGAETFDIGDGVAMLRIPRLGADWQWVVVEGVGPAALRKGPGHYPRTALPGEVGNVGVAAHRATNGEPFAHLDAVRRGDRIEVETAEAVYTYRVQRSEITTPDDVAVIAPVPGHPGREPTERRLTLTTCHPRWGSTHRLVVYGILDTVDHKDGAARALAGR